jgi:hypothetical protein
VNAGLISYLRAHKGSAKYLVAVSGSMQSAPIILATGQPVITMGGFNGSDPAPTLAQFQSLVSSGKVHYVLLNGGGARTGGANGPAFGPGGQGGGSGGLGGLGGPRGQGGPGGMFGSAGRSGPGGMFGPAGNQAGHADQSAIFQWVATHGREVPSSEYGGSGGGTLYYVG